MHFLYALTTAIATLTSLTMAEDEALPPKLTLLYRMKADLLPAIPIDDIPGGRSRQIIPIIGGTFKGPRLSGELFKIMLQSAKFCVKERLWQNRLHSG